jgi:tetratricopeptide (TPR) repeat protein
MNKVYFKLVSLFCISIYAGSVTAQEKEQFLRQQLTSKLDSVLINTYEKLGNHYNITLGKGDSAIFYGSKIVKLSKSIRNPNNEAKGYNLIGLGYATNQDYTSAETHLKKGIEKALLVQDEALLAVLHNRLGGTYQNLDKLPLALKHLLHAVTYSKRVKNYKVLSLSYYGISVIYALQEQTKKQLKYLSKSLYSVETEDA